MDLESPPTLDQSQPGNAQPPAPREERRKKTDLDPASAAVVLLHNIFKALQKIYRGNEPFQLGIIVNATAGSTGFASPARQGLTGGSGVVRFVHNPTAAPVTLTLVDGDNRPGIPMFSAQLAVGETRLVWFPFTSDIMASSGNGCQIAGTYRP